MAAVLTGPAGIGKTALWEWAVEQASRAGYLVLASRAGIAEARLPWVGLTDLLRARRRRRSWPPCRLRSARPCRS